QQLNYEAIAAQPVIVHPHDAIELWVVGCGGTGSFLVQLLCRIVQHFQTQGVSIKLILVDPDTVEPHNLTRQCFCPAELGLNKAMALAARYGITWGLPIEAIASPFERQMLNTSYRTLTVLLGCVDNAKARATFAKTLEYNTYYEAPRLWWIDSGNGDRYGQVLIGSNLSPLPDDYAPTELGWLQLPAPSAQAPELLVPRVEESQSSTLSCAQLTQLNQQGLLVNPQAAVIMAEVTAALLTAKLKRFAVYFDQTTGLMRSSYTTVEAVRASLPFP
ncbi:MAG: hypothetical protein F6K32_27525, partial [Desertifilum sp. SIO1I2]|nr:hypothetical protein [Desertifilum sp. SIO1I2]